jgi:hypothetical protein
MAHADDAGGLLMSDPITIVPPMGSLAAVLKATEPHEGRVYDVDVAIHEVEGWDGEGFTSPMLKPLPLMTGHIKWDGCSDWWPSDDWKEGCFHGCERGHLTALGEIMGLAFDAAGKLMPDTWTAEG